MVTGINTIGTHELMNWSIVAAFLISIVAWNINFVLCEEMYQATLQFCAHHSRRILFKSRRYTYPCRDQLNGIVL